MPVTPVVNTEDNFYIHFPIAIQEEATRGKVVIRAIEEKLDKEPAAPPARAVFRPPPSWSISIVKNFLNQPRAIGVDPKLIPPGFRPDSEGKFSEKDIIAMTGLMDGPNETDRARHLGYFAPTHEKRVQKVLEQFGPTLNRLWQHEATIKEWKKQVLIQLKALDRLLYQVGVGALDSAQEYVNPVEQRNLPGLAGNIVRIPYLNALMQDLLIVTANERAAFEAFGVSTIYRPGDFEVSGKRPLTLPLNLKRFEDTHELLKHIDTVHRYMWDIVAAGGQPAAVRSRTTFAILTQMHSTSSEMLTVMHRGEPKTAILCVDPASAAKVAVELKSFLDITNQDKVVVLVVNSRAQHTISDCLTYSVFHPEKLRHLMTDDPSFDQILHDLLDGKVNAAAYRLPWGKPDGAAVYFIQNDDVPESRILPLSILKETQSESDLKTMLDERGIDQKERERLLSRYREAYAGEHDEDGRSTLMIEKAIKYFKRALEALENLEIVHGVDKGNAILKEMLDRVRQVGEDPEHIVMQASSPAPRELLVQHIEACKENISVLSLYERSMELSHQRYLIGTILGSEEEPEQPDAADKAKLEEFSKMSDKELETLEESLEKEEKEIDARFYSTLRQTGKDPGFISICETRHITAHSETRTLEMLQIALAKLDDAEDDSRH